MVEEKKKTSKLHYHLILHETKAETKTNKNKKKNK